MNLNRGISTPIAILLIVVVSAVVGVLVWQLTKPTGEPMPKQPSDYTTQAACESAGYYWHEDACHETKSTSTEPPEGEQPTKEAGDYTTQSTCKDAGYYWYNGFCYEKQQGEGEEETKLPVPDAPNLSFMEGAKPFIQISWNRQIADHFNIYRATSPEGPWTKISEKFPSNAGSAVDYDYPKNEDLLYYKITSVSEGKESEASEVSSVDISKNTD